MTGEGMTWLEMIPDDTFRVIAAMYFPDGTHDSERKQYPVTCYPVRNKQSPPAALPVTGCFDKPVNDPMDRMFTLDGRLNSKKAVRV